MTPAELEEIIQLLVRLIVDGLLTEDEANLILDAVRTEGALPVGFQLPLTLDEALPDNLEEVVAGYLSIRYSNFSIEQAQSDFENDVADLTTQWLHAQVTLRDWHEKFRDALIAFIATSAAAGAGDDISFTRRGDQVLELIRTQLAYLSRFADSIAINLVSEKQIYNRARMYSGEGRASFFREDGLSNALEGWVEDYLALDDRFTCEPCRLAEEQGPYLLGEGPMPGTVCLGRGFCRCTRARRFDEAAWLRLTGQVQAQAS